MKIAKEVKSQVIKNYGSNQMLKLTRQLPSLPGTVRTGMGPFKLLATLKETGDDCGWANAD